jgi:hypothetical protein
MKLALLIILVAIVSSCGKSSDYSQYAQDFNSDLVAIGRGPVDFSKTLFVETDEFKQKHGADAYCFNKAVMPSGLVIIYVSSNMKIYNETAARYIIYHEIGHCFYGKDHEAGDNLMSPMIGTLAMWSERFSEQNRLRYVLQLVSK